MQNFEKTVDQLDNMIGELEIQTGQAQSVVKEEKVEVKVEVKVEEENQNKQINEEENKKEDKKQQQKKNGGEEKEKVQKKKKPVEVVKVMGDEDNFIMCDMRVGLITSCSVHPESEKLYIEKIDLGEEEDRTIASGLQQVMKIEEVSGKCIVFANLKPRPLGGVPSNGMVMCVKNEAGDLEIMRPHPDTKVGERVVLQAVAMDQAPLPKLNPKKKFAEKVLPLLHSNADGECMFKDWKMMTNGEVIMSKIVNGSIS